MECYKNYKALVVSINFILTYIDTQFIKKKLNAKTFKNALIIKMNYFLVITTKLLKQGRPLR